MSSHHIVREKQEPALLIMSMENFPEELLGQLLEWSPTVIVTAETYYAVDAMGIKIDALVAAGVLDAVVQPHVKVIPAGNQSSTAVVLNYLINHHYSAVNIITDELILKDYLFFADQINLVIYQAHRKIYAVHTNYSKWKAAGEKIEMMEQPVKLKTSGLEKTGEHEYTTTHDGFLTIQFEQPLLFIAEQL
ncbi:MAG: thiamine diphosphokinase [Sphingobacteriaceae bacterium]